MRVSNRFWFILTEMYNCIYASHITQTYRRKCVFCQFVETRLRRERTFCVYLESILVNINTDMYIYVSDINQKYRRTFVFFVICCIRRGSGNLDDC